MPDNTEKKTTGLISPTLAKQELYSNLKLGFISYCIITTDKDGVYTNDNYSDFLNEFGNYIERVLFVGSAATTVNSEYYRPDGASSYRRPITNHHVEVTAAGAVTSSLPLLATLKMSAKKLAIMNSVIAKSDVVYITIPYFLGLLAAALCWLRGKPYGLYVGADLIEVLNHFERTGELKHGFTKLRRSFSIWCDEFLSRRARFIITAGEQSYGKYRLFNTNCHAVKPMVNVTPVDFDFERPLDLKSCCEVLFVGALVPRKNVDQLIRAIAALHKSAPGSVFCRVVGHGKPEYVDMLHNVIKEEDIENIVRFEGRVTDKDLLRSFYRRADVMVLPSAAEGFPRVIYEAMSQGCLVIASGISSISAMLTPELDFFSVQPNDFETIVKAIKRAVSEDVTVAAMRKRNEEFIRERITMATAAQQLTSVLANSGIKASPTT